MQHHAAWFPVALSLVANSTGMFFGQSEEVNLALSPFARGRLKRARRGHCESSLSLRHTSLQLVVSLQSQMIR